MKKNLALLKSAEVCKRKTGCRSFDELSNQALAKVAGAFLYCGSAEDWDGTTSVHFGYAFAV